MKRCKILALMAIVSLITVIGCSKSGEHHTALGNSVYQNVKEMQPKLGRSLDLDQKIAEQWKKADKIMENTQGDNSKLTTENRKFFKQINYNHEDYGTAAPGYWDAISQGCSWYCGGSVDSISASSYLKSNSATINYVPQNAHNLSYENAWVEGAGGHGIGEYLTYYFTPTNPRITRIIIANGYVKSEKAYRENSRVKKLKMYIDGKPFAILNLQDIRREQIFEFEPIGKRTDHPNLAELEKLPKWTIKFEILEVYPGDKHEDTAITLIYFDGMDVHCFAAGTKILMSDYSLKDIELIQKGDIVKSYDFESKKLIDSKVIKLISAEHSSLLRLKFADNEIVATADHPFWIEKNNWAAVNAEKANKNYFQKTKVETLKVGDKVFIPEKNIFSKIINIENVNERQITYTIKLSGGDNFIANGMLVKTETAK